MRHATALALIRRLIRRQDLNATLVAADRLTNLDIRAYHELLIAAEAEDRAARRAGTTDPGSAGNPTESAGRPGAQPRSTGGAL